MMGSLISSFFKKPQIQVFVTTGDRRGAGTDANVWVCIEDETGKCTPDVLLDKLLCNDHERGKTYSYPVWKLGEFEGRVHKLMIFRDDAGIGDHWFLDRVEVADQRTNRHHVFPLQRWVKPHVKYTMHEHHTFLPQHDPDHELRKEELLGKRKVFEYEPRFNRGPLQVKSLPDDEAFSEKYMLDFISLKGTLLAQTMYLKLTTEKWTSLEDIKNVYMENTNMYMPNAANYWTDDEWFGIQRLQGANPVLITHCKEIPDKLGVTPEMMKPFLEGMTLEEALQNDKIFIIDLEILDNVQCKDSGRLVAPIALFYLNRDKVLLPIAIQLHQIKGPNNKVYLPTDPPYNWVLAKMFYNMAEAQHHQSSTHLGLTHLLMEGICVCTHRHLSPSHPIFKLLAPHFLYLLAINSRGLEKLIQPGGWVDTGMSVGVKGMFQLIERSYLRWNFTTNGMVPNEIKSRGVYEAHILPNYPYRDDAVDLYEYIRQYVYNCVSHFYDTPDKIEEDHELQAWRDELGKARDEGGLELQGVPGKDGRFTKMEEIADAVTVLISTCSLGHSAANFQQYEAYGFVPNYPGKLTGLPPDDDRELTENDIIKYLPDKKTTLDIMVITKLLSMKGTKSLGDFEVQYLYDPHSVNAAKEFRLNLERLSRVIDERNLKRKYKFDWLNPKIVPNSISI